MTSTIRAKQGQNADKGSVQANFKAATRLQLLSLAAVSVCRLDTD